MNPTDLTAIAGLITTILGYSIGGVTIQHTLENCVMKYITNPTLKVGVVGLAGVAAAFLYDLTQGIAWQQAASTALSKGIMLAGSALVVHQSPVGADASKAA